MINDDEREMRAVLKFIAEHGAQPLPARDARTILALLDRPTLPRPEDVPKELVDQMWQAHAENGGGRWGMECALHVLHDQYAQPPASPAIWSVFTKGNMLVGFFVNEDEATECAHRCAGRRVVKYVEDRDGR